MSATDVAGKTGWLYRYEARGIQRYVTATARLEEVAGASAIVEELKEHAYALALGAGGSIVADQAGSATIAFDDEAGVLRFAEWWPMVAARVAPGLPMVQAAVERASFEHHPLPALRTRLDAAYQRRYVDLPEAGPFMHRSGRSGRPAISRGRRKGKRDMRDIATDRKVRAIKSPHASGQVALSDDALGRRFLGELKTGGRPLLSRHEDFGDGYIAVVHIDGNDMGERVLAAATVDQYAALANALATATKAAAQAAMAVLVLRDEERRDAGQRRGGAGGDGPIPARPVVLGGDDCTIVTLAEDAIPFVVKYLKVLEDEGRKPIFGACGLTACAGIAFMKPRAPISLGLTLADELCRDAKKCLRGEGANGETPSAVLFHRVTTSGFAHWRDIQAQELAAVPPEKVHLQPGGLAYGPYRLTGERSLHNLTVLAGAVRAMPSGPLREWLRVARTDPRRAALRWHRLKEVAAGRGTTQWGAFADAVQGLQADPETGWGKSLAKDPSEATPLHDAITLRMLDACAPSGSERAQVTK